MTAVLCLEPFGVENLGTETKDHRFFNTVIARYERVADISSHLADVGWHIEVFDEDGIYYYCVAHPPKSISEEEIETALRSLDIDYSGIGWIGEEDDFEIDRQINGDVSIDDHDDDYSHSCEYCDCDFEDDEDEEDDDDEEDGPIIPLEMAESLVGCKILDVELIDDYRLVFHLDDERKLVYDEDELGFSIID